MEQITLPGVLESLEGMAEFLSGAVKAAGLEKRAAGRLHLAVDEMVTNIITHGYQENGLTGDVVMKREISPEALTIITEDTAPQFDPRTLAIPDSLNKPLEDREPGGVGVYLMLKSVSEYRYEYKDGKNISTFVMNLAAPMAG